jgi:hypothetical protein
MMTASCVSKQTRRNILRHGGDSFTTSSKEGELRIFFAHKNPSSSARFEPANVGSNDKHNHYTTEPDSKIESKDVCVQLIRHYCE